MAKAKLTNEAIECMYSYARKVYHGELSKIEAIKKVKEKFDDSIVSEGSCQMYITLFDNLMSNKTPPNGNPEVFKYYVEHIFEDEGKEAGTLAYNLLSKFSNNNIMKKLLLETKEKYNITENVYNIGFDQFYRKFHRIVDDRKSNTKSNSMLKEEKDQLYNWIKNQKINNLSVIYVDGRIGGNAKSSYRELFEMLSDDSERFNKLKELGYFFDEKEITGRYFVRYKNTTWYYHVDDEPFVFMLKSVKLLLDLNMEDKLRDYSFEYELVSKGEGRIMEDDSDISPFDKNINRKIEEYANALFDSKNIILRGAPGTGKSYLAHQIAAYVVSNKTCIDIENEDYRDQIEFVQFHPSYDYTDFVEGIRPRINPDGTMGFALEDGIFKKFVSKARNNYENSKKTHEEIEKVLSAQEALEQFLSNVKYDVDEFKTINGSVFTITNADNNHIYISIPANEKVNKLCLNTNEIRRMLESGDKFEGIKDITNLFGKQYATQGYSYDFAIYKKIISQKTSVSVSVDSEKLKNYVFIIDEINRGEISKIFGELFFSIDPGYRGNKEYAISTQYSNLHETDEKFYIPDNVYIIGTMNDIDRSVDSFDFAMRRRFQFIEIKAGDRIEMLNKLNDEKLKNEAKIRMEALNKAIAATEELNENYQIGASYFLKLDTLSFDELWKDYLKPLLQEYVHGMNDEEQIMKKYEDAYNNPKSEQDTEYEN